MTRFKARKTGFRRARLDNMVPIPGGTFEMGSQQFYPEEKPVRRATVRDFWMDETPVTNDQFAVFVKATGYVTLAEIPPDPADYPGMDPALAQPASLVFTPPDRPIPLNRPLAWWSFVPGACWKHPLGPGSDLVGLGDHPVVHITHQDAAAYAKWARKKLPTEAEWEYAARGGLEGKEFAWGDEFEPGGVSMAKTFRGTFPYENKASEGLERTAPVKSYPPNGFGLYDMIANVWEWTADWYDMRRFDPDAPRCCSPERASRAGPQDSIDPNSPEAPIPRRVLKGGSHLCAPNYCQRYRPAARWPQPIDTSTSHLGFRCIVYKKV